MGYLLDIARKNQRSQNESAPSRYEVSELASSSIIDTDPSVGEGSTISSPLEIVEMRGVEMITQPNDDLSDLAPAIPDGHSTPAEQLPFPQGAPEVRQQIQPKSNLKPVWPPEVQALVDWFLTLNPREIKPFYLEPHIRVGDPVKFCAGLRREIQTGPNGPRARSGALQDDLRKLIVALRPSASDSPRS